MAPVRSPVGVKNWTLSGFLIGLLVISATFALWFCFEPYAWNPDPAARCKVVGVEVKKDRAYYWVDVNLKVTKGQKHDLEKPARLVTSTGREIEPADTTIESETGGPVIGMWFKFWLEHSDMAGPLSLRINDGSLSIKAGPGVPVMVDSQPRMYSTHNW